MAQEQTDEKGCCPAENYEEIYTKKVDCFHCNIPLSECSYWIARSKDKEIKRDDYGCYLLGGKR